MAEIMLQIETRGMLESTAMYQSTSFVYSNITTHNLGCHETDLVKPEHFYVNLSTLGYCFLALITTLGLAISLISNMIIIYLFIR